jgi:hypothetical protein
MDCTVAVDGHESDRDKPNGTITVPVRLGNHLIDARSTDGKYDSQQTVSVQESMQVSVKINLRDLKSTAKAAVSYRSGDDFVSVYLAQPSGGGRHPAIILIHEWWGLTDWVKQQAQRYAAQGYVALAVDLYHGKVGTTRREARSLMRTLPEDRALQDLEAAFAYLITRADVDPQQSDLLAGAWVVAGRSDWRQTSLS